MTEKDHVFWDHTQNDPLFYRWFVTDRPLIHVTFIYECPEVDHLQCPGVDHLQSFWRKNYEGWRGVGGVAGASVRVLFVTPKSTNVVLVCIHFNKKHVQFYSATQFGPSWKIPKIIDFDDICKFSLFWHDVSCDVTVATYIVSWYFIWYR